VLPDTDKQAAFVAALNNHYFILQSAASSTITESAARASLYLVSLSISLVAMALVAQAHSVLDTFLAVVLPTLFVLGLFSVVRLVDTGVQNLAYLQSMAMVRRYYAELTPEAGRFFGDGPNNPLAQLSRQARQGAFGALFTIGSMIAMINSVVGGTGAALLVSHLLGGFGRAPALALGSGLAVGLGLFAAFLVYQHRRYRVLVIALTEEKPA